MLRRLASLCCSVAYAGWQLTRPANRTTCIVLYYHGVTAAQRRNFEWQMRWLKAHYSVVSLGSILKNADRRQVCITFDDGLDNVRLNALPVLCDLQIPATVFAVPGNLGREPSWSMAASHPDRHELLSTAEQLREYPAELIEVGSHSLTHPDLSMLAGEQLRRELGESKSALESILERRVKSLSVPFGAYNAETLQVAKAVGYETVATCDPVIVHSRNQWVIGRFKTTPNDWSLEFRLKAAGAGQWRKAWQNWRTNQTSKGLATAGADSVISLREFSR